MPNQPVNSSPSVVTSSNNPELDLMQAIIAGMNPQAQSSMQAKLAIMARKQANKRYIRECIEKHAPAKTNGQLTQPYSLGTSLTFNLPQPNNSYTKGIIVSLTVNYTLAAGTGATYAPTAAGALGLIDTIEVKYNRSQIKLYPVYMRHLAMIGALHQYMLPDVVVGGMYQDSWIQSYLNNSLNTNVGAQTYTGQFYIPFNFLSADEDRGLLPSMPGETGIQVYINTPQGILGPDPRKNAIYSSGGTGNAISGISGTVGVTSVYLDGDVLSSPTKLSYDMSVLNGTIQTQPDSVVNNLVAGGIMRNKLVIMGLHQYAVFTVIDGNQSNLYCANSNIQYIESAQDDTGANVFFKYGVGCDSPMYDYFGLQRRLHYGDLDEGVLALVQAPVQGQSARGMRNGTAQLDNTRNGWPAWHYGIQLGSVSTSNGIVPRIEPMVTFVNPLGLQTL